MTVIALPTASAIERALACPGSAVIEPVPSTTADNTAGRDLHLAIARAREIGKDQAIAEIADEAVRERFAALDLGALPARAEHEVALAWDPAAGPDGRAERLSLAGHRAYPHDGRYFGTADLVGQVDPDTVFVADLKSGELKTSAAACEQLRTLAVFAATLVGASRAVVMLLQLRHGGGWRESRAELDVFDLDEQRERLRELRGRLWSEAARYASTGRVALHEGPWCEHCAAFSRCPAKVTLALAVVGRSQELEAGTTRALTADEKGQLWHRLQEARDVLERVDHYLRTEAAREPIPLGGDRVYAEVPWSKRVIHRARAVELLEAHYGPEIAAGAQSISLVGLRGAFASSGRPEEAKEAEALLGREGAMVKVRSKQLRVVLAKEAKP